jgi:IS30 family transposase
MELNPLRRPPVWLGRQVGVSAHIAQARSEERARRPKAGKLVGNPELRAVVAGLLAKRYSPEQIAGLLAKPIPIVRRCECLTKPI